MNVKKLVHTAACAMRKNCILNPHALLLKAPACSLFTLQSVLSVFSCFVAIIYDCAS